MKDLEEKQIVYGNIEYKGASFGAEFGVLHKNSSEYFQAVTEENNIYEYLAEHDGIMFLNIGFLEKLFGVEFQSGEKVRLSWFDGEEHSQELEIAALIEEFGGDIENFFMTDQTIKKLWPNMNTASMFLISVEEYEKNGERVEQEIKTMLFWESLFIMLPNIVITLTIGTAAGFGIIVYSSNGTNSYSNIVFMFKGTE